MQPMIFIILFTFTFSFLCLFFPIKMWNQLLRFSFGPVVISEKTGTTYTRFMGIIFGAIGIGLLAVLIDGTIDFGH